MTSTEHAWPEPVTRVQQLSDSGIRVIPGRYVKKPEDHPGAAASDGPNIPVIDMEGLSSGDAEVRRRTAALIDAACREWGFFQVANHGVSPALMARCREAWREFFQLPLAEKQRELAAEYSREVVELCGKLMKILARNLGLREDYLLEAFGGEEELGACMRVNYYPKCPQPDRTLGLSSHSDPGGLTLLYSDENVSGLQIRRGDTWITVKPQPNTFIVNLGDQLQILSNANYKSVEHRAIVNSAKERVSLAYFYNPKGDKVIKPAEELVSPEQPLRYSPTTYNDYRLYVRKKGLHGKTQVESL
ncbi:hypothetical protein SASPL_101988 [Salvia splendens]|uniref:Fe2OG dioxygenase domain-containing protein n=1 Tax=Salvia splendens TaxID=180675 RepID=A0A8X8YSU8_SALSN|nr:hypothetical protein SASPL_101988 [Salvia splendens]